MKRFTSRTRALLLGASSVSLLLCSHAAQAQSVFTLDAITVLPTKTPESIWDSLSSVSAIREDQLEKIMPSRPSDILQGMPNVSFQERPDDPGTAVTIRGLQDFGRVAVVIDGARQNFQRTGHAANGTFYLEPELVSGADVVRGPVANIYGSGAIGGVVSFSTKDVDDILRAGQNYGVQTRGEFGSNEAQANGSSFAAARTQNVDLMVGGTYRYRSDYRDGNGTEVANTAYTVWSGIAKLTVRPADGHTVKFGYIDYNTTFNNGQPVFFGPFQASNIYNTQVHNQIANLRWLYSKPSDRLFDFDGSIYWTKTSTDQTKTDGLPPAFGGIGNIGDSRNFSIDTIGGDFHNTSRFDFSGIRNALTVGVDGFRDTVDTSGFGVVFTPSGERTVSGAFAQWKANYSTWLEVIGALRYDRYELNGTGVNIEGDHLSPKLSVGITPIRGLQPYATYAEGYRAPSLTETLNAGLHPSAAAPFEFIPNPSLQPEIGKTKEIGVNVKYDDVFWKGDAFRAKFDVFRNDVDNYIEQTIVPLGGTGAGGVPCLLAAPPTPFCLQYQNITKAKLEGFEFESIYDAGGWFAGLAASQTKGKDVTTGAPLATVPPNQVTTTLGARFLDRKLVLSVRWQAVAAKDLSDIPVDLTGTPTYPPTGSYNLVNLYASYAFNPDVLATFAIENLLNEQYAVYTSSAPNPVGGPAIPLSSPGFTVKGALKVRFGDDFFKKG